MFPDAVRQGCSFHFSQAVMKKINVLGLSPQYNKDGATRDILKQMMALCYIPHYCIRPLFNKLAEQCTTPKLAEFAEYMRTTWIENDFISPEMWSVFNILTRTNNALEGKLFII